MNKLTPYITEKSVALAKSRKFTLVVPFTADKAEIKALVKQFYKVNPLSIRIIKGKYLFATKYRKNYLSRGIKKAIIELEKDQSIPGFEFESKDDKKKEKKSKNAVIKQEKENGKES